MDGISLAIPAIILPHMAESRALPVKLSNTPQAARVYFEVSESASIAAEGAQYDQAVSRVDFHLDEICDTISQVAAGIGKGLAQLKAKRTTVEFGVEVAAEAGHLTALIVKGTGKANLKVTVEWS